MIRVAPFQPFASRVGVDTVVGLQFGYDEELIGLIKAALREAKARTRRKFLGGWKADYRRWFVEWVAWPHVRSRLIGAGYDLDESDLYDDDDEYDEDQDEYDDEDFDDDQVGDLTPAKIRALITSWYRQMSLKYHPDRGGSNEAMKVVNDGVEQLRAMLAELQKESRESPGQPKGA
jgi:hypothetical protein